MKSRTQSSHEAKREYWQQQISNWQASGLSQKKYCRSHSLALSTFCYWKNRINKPDPAVPKFYPLTVPVLASNSSDAGLLLLVGSKQIQVQIKKDFSQSTLKKLVATLEEI